MVKKFLVIGLLSMGGMALAMDIKPELNNLSDAVSIEILDLKDIEQTASVFHNGFLAAYGRFKPEEIGVTGDMESYLREWFIDHCNHVRHCEKPLYCIVAKHNKAIVGYIVFETLDNQGTIYLYSIAVDPSVHGKGIGTRLISAISDVVPTRKIIVHTRNVNSSAIFYKKLGFKDSNIKSPYYQELAHVLIGFELDLAD